MLDKFKPVEGKPLTFALEDSGSTVTFKPLYRVIHESYGVYIETGNVHFRGHFLHFRGHFLVNPLTMSRVALSYHPCPASRAR